MSLSERQFPLSVLIKQNMKYKKWFSTMFSSVLKHRKERVYLYFFNPFLFVFNGNKML